MKLYGGIDLHSNNSVIALLDDEDKVVYRRRLANDLELVLGELAPFHEAIEGLVVESTYNWYWLVDGLMEAGYRVHLANTAAIVQYEGLKYADDDTPECRRAQDAKRDVPVALSPCARRQLVCAADVLRSQRCSTKRSATAPTNDSTVCRVRLHMPSACFGTSGPFATPDIRTRLQPSADYPPSWRAADARWLAKLLRLGLLPEGYIYPKEERPVRDLLRKRGQLVHQHTSNLHSIQNLMARNRGHSLSANRIKRLSYEDVDRLLPDFDLALAVKSTLAVMRTLDGAIGMLEKRVKARIRLSPQFKPLLTVSGIGQILGLTIMLETGEIGRFAKVGNYASYCRCVGSEHLSNGKRKGRGNTKNGNKYLAWAYVEAANFAVRYNPQIRRYYQRKCARTNRIVAIKTVAHKLARACYYILRDQAPFDVSKAFA